MRKLHVYFTFCIAIVFSLFITTKSFSQVGDKPGFVKIIGTVTDYDDNKLDRALVRFFLSGELRKELISDKKGEFTTELDINKSYIIKVSFPGMVSKQIRFDTFVPEEESKGFWWEHKFSIGLFKDVEGLDVSVLKEEPATIMKYEVDFGEFDFDHDYTNKMNEKIDVVRLQQRDLIKKKFDKLVLDAGKSANSGNLTDAVVFMVEARDLLPERKEAQTKLKEYLKQLNGIQSDDKIYKELIAKADEYSEQAKYNEAKPYYKSAKLFSSESYPDNKLAEIHDILLKNPDVEAIQEQKLNEEFQALFNKGNQLLEKKEYSEAKIAFTKALEIKPEDKDTKKIIDEINKIEQELLQAQKQKKEVQEYNNVLENINSLIDSKLYGRAQGKINEAIQQYPGKGKLTDLKLQVADLIKSENNKKELTRLQQLGDNAMSEDDFSKAISYYEKALALNNSDNELTKKLNLAKEKFNSKDKKTDVADVVKKDPNIDKYIKHKVQKGESLFKISQKYDVSVSDISSYNTIDNDIVIPGTKLIIPILQEDHESKPTDNVVSESDETVVETKDEELIEKIENKKPETVSAEKSERNLELKLKLFQEELKVKEEENDAISIALLLDSIANIFHKQNVYNKAINSYEDAVEIKEELGDKEGAANLYDDIGVVYFDSGRYDIAIEKFERSIDLKSEIGDKEGMADNYSDIGDIYKFTFEPDKAVESYNESMEIRKDLKDEKGVAMLMSAIADVYFEEKKYDKSIDYYGQSLKLDEKFGDSRNMAATYNNIGIGLLKKGDIKESIEKLNQAAEIYNELNDIKELSQTYNNIGNAYKLEKKLNEALSYYEKSLDLKESLGYKEGIIMSYYNIANIYKELKNSTKAIDYFNKSLRLSKEIDFVKALIMNNYAISGVYANINQFEKAYDSYVEFVNYKYYSGVDEDLGQQMVEVQEKYEKKLEIRNLKNTVRKKDILVKLQKAAARKEIELKNKELARRAEEVRRQKFVIVSLVFIFIIVIVFSIVVFRLYRRIKKVNNRLSEQNEEILQQKEEIMAQRDALEDANVELEKLSIVAGETDNAVIIMDATGNLEYVNRGFERLYGYGLDELIANKGINFIDASSNPDAKEAIQACIGKRQTVEYNSKGESLTGEQFWARTTLTPILDENGGLTKIVAIDSNISDLKLAEEEIRQRNEEISAQKDLLVDVNRSLETKNMQILDSIRYAKSIQQAILPDLDYLYSLIPESFVFFRPKDIVSGDFYWMAGNKDKLYVAAADCTGHGVPGAFMSMIGTTLLNDIVSDSDNITPADVLSELNERVVNSLNQRSEGKSTQEDGMDISLCCIDFRERKVDISLAGHEAFIVRNNELITVNGDLFSIGGMFSKEPGLKYTQQTYSLDDKLTLYMFSDGYQDQFGGPDNKKFMAGNMGKLFLENDSKNMSEIREKLAQSFDSWKGTEKQLDDVIVIGLRLG